MRVVAVVPTHRRKLLTMEVVRNLYAQTMGPVAVIVIGSEAEDMEAANESGAEYVYHPNQPLSFKKQAGILHAMQFNPEAILECDSDSWVSSNWIETLSAKITDGYDLVGHGSTYIIDFNQTHGLELWRISPYKGTKREGQSIGAGRLFSRRILDAMGWMVYTEPLATGCDGSSFRRVLLSGGKTFVYWDNDIQLLCPKGAWECLNPHRFFWALQHRTKIEGPEKWMDENFPGILEKISSINREAYAGIH